MSALSERVEAARAAEVVASALRPGPDGAAPAWPRSEPWVVFHDLGLLRRRIMELTASFPPGTLHAVAVKANPLVEVLRVAVEAGAGLEAASVEEVHVALAAGCPPGRIVFDSPAKTEAEIAFALDAGIRINADGLDELERIARRIGGEGPRSPIGLRVNPMVGAGRIGITSVANGGSKFGMRLDTERRPIIDAFVRFPWLTGLHVHVGSQGCELEQLVRAAVKIAALREVIHAAVGHPRVDTVDIGGGLPVAYGAGDAPPALGDYVRSLRADAPALFGPDVQLVTELGRAIQAGCGTAASRVEYVKTVAGRPLAVVHFGADFLMRAVYQPEHWRHELDVLDRHGRAKRGPRRSCTIAGPLCFAGDIVARDRELPEIEPGDIVVARDAGAYTLSMWSRHCSRGLPLVMGHSGYVDARFQLLRGRETPEAVAAFWGAQGGSRGGSQGRATPLAAALRRGRDEPLLSP